MRREICIVLVLKPLLESVFYTMFGIMETSPLSTRVAVMTAMQQHDMKLKITRVELFEQIN